MISQDRLRKRLTPNDLGTTGSHQAGLHIPKPLAEFFPELDEQCLNPSLWITVNTGMEMSARWRFIHYNNGRVSDGTRDEYRITYTRQFLRDAGAQSGDVLELERLASDSYAAAVLKEGNEGEVLVLRTTGPWAVVRLKSRR